MRTDGGQGKAVPFWGVSHLHPALQTHRDPLALTGRHLVPEARWDFFF